MIIIDFINNLSLLIALSVISGKIINFKFFKSKLTLNILQGILFGLTSIVGMLHPFVFHEGIFFDGRTIIVSICTLFFGPVSGLIASIINLAFRVYLGGDGVPMAIAIVVVAFLVGFIFNRYEKSKAYEYISTKRLYLMGLIVHLGMMSFIFLLPSQFVQEAIYKITLSVLVIFPLVSTLIGKILIGLQLNKDFISQITKKEKFFRTTLYSIGDGVIITDQNSIVLNMNEIAEEMTGWKENEAKGKSLNKVFRIISEETNEEVLNPVDKVLKHGKIIGLANHTLLIKRDGSKIPIADSGAPITNEDNEIEGVVLVFKDQSEEKLTQKIIYESNEKFSKIFHSTSNAISLTELESGKIVEINAAFESLFGYKRLEAIGKTTIELGLWTNSSDREKLVSALKSDGRVKDLEMIGMNKNGDLKTALLSADKFQIEDKNLILLNLHDITERKKSEEALKESEMKNKAFVKAIPDMIFLVSKNGEFLDYKSDTQNILLLAPELFIGKHIREVLPKDIATLTLEKMILLFKTNEIQIFEYQLEIKNKLYSFENRLVLFGENQVLSMVRDITNKVESEKLIRKLSRAVEQSPISIVITDIKNNIEYVNPKFTEVTGYTFAEVKGKNPRILKSQNMSKTDFQVMWSALLNQREWQGEFNNQKKNGERFWESTTISPIINGNGEITNFIAIKEDVSVKRRMTDELIAAKEKAEEMNKIKSYFFANMSHELRTPFIGILGFSELLFELTEDAEMREYAEQILKSSKRLTETLNKILDVTRMEFDKFEPKLVTTNACKIIGDIVSLYYQAAKTNNTILSTNFQTSDTLITTDKKLFEEILINLLSNAIKFTHNGTIELFCKNLIINDKKIFEFKIADTGVGIPKAKHDVIWREFRQVSEGYNRTFEGTGLGLTITKKYVEILGGTISLESDEGMGSVFTVQLPNENGEKVELPKEKKDNELVRQVTDAELSKGLNLLYVEDDIITSNYLKIVFKSKYRIDTANNAFVALEKIKRFTYDILLLDINLGKGMNGVELMQKIKELDAYKNVPIIAVTAYAEESDRIEFLEKGFTHYIAKPFTRQQIITFLETVVTGS